jgi:septum site-determining protein MinC
MPKSLGLHSIKKTFEREIAISETKFHKGSLRSGQKLETEGSLVVIGDVNSGAEVMASDNIVVLGSLRGLAHAGAKGNKQAIIAAGLFDAVQVRIANIVKEIDREEEPMHKQAYISVINDKIVIE